MGADGGSIPRRDDLVKTKSKDLKSDPKLKWFFCALSEEALLEPVVACKKGRLYNRDAVIKYLLNKEQKDEFRHIKSLKDVITLKLQKNIKNEKITLAKTIESMQSNFVCPISGDEMNGKHKFFYYSCGHTVSERAIREIKTTNCLVCNLQSTTVLLCPEERIKVSTKIKKGVEKRQPVQYKSQAIKSIYGPSDDSGRNFLTRGTFNRYA